MAEEKNFENKIKKFLDEQNCWYVKYWGVEISLKLEYLTYSFVVMVNLLR